MSKAQLSKEIGISTYAINKLISDDLETINPGWEKKLNAYFGSADETKKEEPHKDDRVTLSIDYLFFHKKRLNSLIHCILEV